MTEDTEIIQKVKDYRYYDNVVGLYSSTSDVSNWKREIRQELRLLENGGYVEYDYDEEIDLYIIEQAKSLIDDLPILVLSPELSINSDGTLVLEWAKREEDENLTMLSVILNGEELILSFMHRGNIKHYEASLCSEYSVKSLVDILNEYFEKVINGQSHAAIR